jgi:hypothetical protein
MGTYKQLQCRELGGDTCETKTRVLHLVSYKVDQYATKQKQ